MVVTIDCTTREAIGRRLGELLDKWNIPPRGRPAWLAGKLQSRVRVTHQAVRKWLEGDSLPDLEKLCLIAQELRVSLDWLVTGRGPMCSDDMLVWPFGAELHERYMSLSASQRVQAQAALHSRIIELEESEALRSVRPKKSLRSAETRSDDSSPVVVMNQVRNQRAAAKRKR